MPTRLSRLEPVEAAAGALYPFFGILRSPIIAVAAMSFSSVSVIGNALRQNRRPVWCVPVRVGSLPPPAHCHAVTKISVPRAGDLGRRCFRTASNPRGAPIR